MGVAPQACTSTRPIVVQVPRVHIRSASGHPNQLIGGIYTNRDLGNTFARMTFPNPYKFSRGRRQLGEPSG